MAGCTFKLLIHSARQVVQISDSGALVLAGEQMKHAAVLEGDATTGFSVVVSNDGIIQDIGKDEDIKEQYRLADFETVIDASGKCLLPGLVDAHTHAVFAGDRVKEFSMKLRGATYMDVHRAGGGIHFTVERTKAASEEELLQLLLPRLDAALHSGTTLLEAKSGYGLDACSELKMLRVLERAKTYSKVEISSTFCGAHAVPKHLTSGQATEAILNDQLPALQEAIAKDEVKVDSIDVFCEKGVFDVEQSRRILKEGKKLGLRINFHGDELHPTGSAEMGAKLGAEAVSHLEEVSEEGIRAMARAGTIAVLLPTTAHVLRLKPPPARKMILEGVAVALGSDFNPNAFCYSVPLVMNFACILCGLTLDEALIAGTLNAAAALGYSKTHGSIEKGKFADLLLINAPRWEHLIYQMGAQPSLIHSVIKKGEVVYHNAHTSQLI